MDSQSDSTKFVAFDQYCPTCKYSETSATHDPCNDCLAIGGRDGTDKPEYYKEKEK